MARDGLLIGEVAAKSGLSRKALRLYEKAGILPSPRRTGSGYRMYGPETLALLGFVTQARRLGFRLEEIKRIVVLKRSGRRPSARGPGRSPGAASRAAPVLAVPPTPFCRWLSLYRTSNHREGKGSEPEWKTTR